MPINRHALNSAAQLREQGKPVVAIIGWRVPVEPILACGMTPILFRPDLDMPTPQADALLSADERADVRSLVQMIIGGTLDFADLIVIAPPFTNVSMTVEELRRLDLIERSVPGTYYFEFQVERDEANRAFAQDRVRAFANRLASASASGSGRVDDAALQSAIAATNKARRAARELEATRQRQDCPSGTAVIAAMGKADWLSPGDQLANIAALASAPGAAGPGPRALLVSSSVLGDTRIHALIEEAGATVVGEDDIYGSCHADGEIAEDSADPLAAIADFYHDNQPPQRTTPEEIRRRWYREAVKRPDVDCVIFYAEYAYWGWDLPALRRLAEAEGKRTLTLERDVRLAAQREKAFAELSAFVSSFSAEAEA